MLLQFLFNILIAILKRLTKIQYPIMSSFKTFTSLIIAWISFDQKKNLKQERERERE